MKVIISAYACQPNMGSEEGVAWNWANQIAKRGYEVHVITRAESRQAIEAELEQKAMQRGARAQCEAPDLCEGSGECRSSSSRRLASLACAALEALPPPRQSSAKGEAKPIAVKPKASDLAKQGTDANGSRAHCAQVSEGNATTQRSCLDAMHPAALCTVREEVANLSFYYLDTPAVLRKFSNFWGWLYYAWQIGLAFKAKQLHREIGFDLAHHITYATDWMPSGLAVLNIPFIWGPVGGSTHKLPKQLKLNLSPEAKRAERKRNILQWLVKTFDPFLKLTMKRAAIILPYTQEAVAGIPDKYRYKTTPIIHIGTDIAELSSGDRQIDTSEARELRIFTGGRLVHWKGFDLLLEGLSLHLQETGANTKIICTCVWSEGKAYFNSLAESFGVEKHVELLGRLPNKSDVLDKMRNCDLYALPTWRDGPPTAILEAMVQGLPILCLDLGATSELVPDGAGFKIPAHNHQQIVRDIAAAITQASKDKSALLEMGKVGQKHALEVYDWDKIGDEIESIYERVLCQ